MPYEIPKERFKRYPRPLQGNAYVLSGGGGRGGGRGRGGLATQYQRALDKANRKNEERYRDILGNYDALHGRVMGDLAGVGEQQAKDIDRRYQAHGSDVYNDLIRRGFGGGSLRSTMQQGVNREHSEAQRRLQEGLMRQRSLYDTNITQGKMGVMERRTDAGPDLNQMLGLMQGLGRGGYGMGGGMGGGIDMGNWTFNPSLGRNLYNLGLARHFGARQGGFPPGMMQAMQKAMAEGEGEGNKDKIAADAWRDARFAVKNREMRMKMAERGRKNRIDRRGKAKNPYAFDKAMHLRRPGPHQFTKEQLDVLDARRS